VTGIDKLLRDALDAAGESFEPASGPAPREAFLRRAKRRRAYAVGSFVLAGAALAALVFFVGGLGIESSPDRVDESVSGIDSARVVARIQVGDAPSGATAGRGSVWVANSGDGTVSLIDMQSNRVTDTIEVGGTPLDVALAGRRLWVSIENEPRLVAIDTTDLSLDDVELRGGSTSLAISSSGRYLWAVSPDAPLQRIDTTTLGVSRHSINVEDPVDLTVGGGKVWVLGADGRIDQIDEVSGLDPEATLNLEGLVGTTNLDLEWDGTGLWVSDGDSRSIVRLDPQTGSVTARNSFKGRYAHLSSSSEGELWAVVETETSDGSLLLIDSGTGRPAPGSIALAGGPGGIVASGDSVWTVDKSSGHVVRVDLTAGSPRAPRASSDRVRADEILYVHSSNGDLSAVYGDGGIEKLTETPEDESNPSFIAEDTIVFERTDSTGLVTVVTRDLESGEEAATPIVGHEVGIGPDGRAAWVLPKNDPSEQTRIRIGWLDGSGRDFFVANPQFQPLEVRNLEWDPSGSKLYYEAGRGTMGLYEVDLRDPRPRAVDPPEASAAYLGPSSSQSDEAVVLRVCCRTPNGYDMVELGRLVLGGGAPAYSRISGLDKAGFNSNSSSVTLEPAGTLEVEETAAGREWSVGSVRSWILTDGMSAWLVDEQGEIDLLRPTRVVGVSVNPVFRD